MIRSIAAHPSPTRASAITDLTPPNSSPVVHFHQCVPLLATGSWIQHCQATLVIFDHDTEHVFRPVHPRQAPMHSGPRFTARTTPNPITTKLDAVGMRDVMPAWPCRRGGSRLESSRSIPYHFIPFHTVGSSPRVTPHVTSFNGTLPFTTHRTRLLALHL